MAVAGLAAASTGIALAVESQPSDAPKSQLQAFRNEQSRSIVLGLEFYVNDLKAPMRTRDDNGRDVVETQIGTGEFEIVFPKRESDMALRMVAWTDRTIFSLEPGTKLQDIPFLKPGTSMADNGTGRMTLFLNPAAHNDYVKERVQQHNYRQEKVQFEGMKDATTAERTPVTEGPIFVTAVMDYNGNDVVDKGEFEYFNIGFGSGDEPF